VVHSEVEALEEDWQDDEDWEDEDWAEEEEW